MRIVPSLPLPLLPLPLLLGLLGLVSLAACTRGHLEEDLANGKVDRYRFASAVTHPDGGEQAFRARTRARDPAAPHVVDLSLPGNFPASSSWVTATGYAAGREGVRLVVTRTPMVPESTVFYDDAVIVVERVDAQGCLHGRYYGLRADPVHDLDVLLDGGYDAWVAKRRVRSITGTFTATPTPE